MFFYKFLGKIIKNVYKKILKLPPKTKRQKIKHIEKKRKTKKKRRIKSKL